MSASAINFMMTETNQWYCFEFETDPNTEFELEYWVTGVRVEENTKFKAVQGKGRVHEPIVTDAKRYTHEAFTSSDNEPIDFCWMKSDDAAKKVQFEVARNHRHSKDKADKDTLYELEEMLLKVERDLYLVSEGIERQRTRDIQNNELATNSASTQTWMSVIKMLIVIGICFVQVYLITNHF